MLKKRIKLLAAMVALVILVAALSSTNAKFTGSKTLSFNMSVEPNNDGALHGAFRDYRINPVTIYNGVTVPKADGSGDVTCNLLWETQNVDVALYGTTYNTSCLKITTVANSDATYNDENIKICLDPHIELNLVTAFTADSVGYENGMPYTVDAKTYDGASTEIIKYMVISYYVPATKTSVTRAAYNTQNYSVNDYNHLRVYTSNTANHPTKFGTFRFIQLPSAFTLKDGETVSTLTEGKGSWVTEIIDLAAVNLRGITYNNKDDDGGNGYANWDKGEYVYSFRIDIGQIGAREAWFSDTRKHDCPEGKSVYIKDIMFFNSYYRAVRAKVNLHAANIDIDPTVYEYSNPIQVDSGRVIPSTTVQHNADYNYVDTSTENEDTVAEPTAW